MVEKISTNTDELIFITCLVMLVLLMLCFFFIFFFIRFKEKQTAYIKSKLQMQNEYENVLLNAQIEIQEQTLLAVSQEIHDNIGQTLTVAKLYLKNETNSEDTSKPNVKELISKAIHDLRQLSKTLNSDRIKQIGFFEAFKLDLSIIQQSGQIEVNLEIDGVEFRMNENVELILYRVCQEIISNIIKHAQATIVYVHMVFETNSFKLEISDNGIGFNIDECLVRIKTDSGVGLQNITKRMKLINGKIEILSDKNRGTKHLIHLMHNI
jgi:two-component system, NarL family, sensor kinase